MLASALLWAGLALALPGGLEGGPPPEEPLLRGPFQWKVCRIESPAYTGPCRFTALTAGGNTVNLHFSLDEVGSRGLSFVWFGERLDLPQEVVFFLVVQHGTGQDLLIPSSGICTIAAEAAFCMSTDRRFRAQAQQPLP